MNKQLLKELLKSSYLQGVMNHLKFNPDSGKEFSEILDEDFEQYWLEKTSFIDAILLENMKSKIPSNE